MTALFVVGAPRSGTTLMRNILRGFDGVYLLPDEFQILPALVREVEGGASARDIAVFLDSTVFAGHMRRRGLWPSASKLADIFEGKTAAAGFRDLVQEIAMSEGIGSVTWWGDKTPENVFHLDLVERLWPDVQVIEVVRDPRSTTLSMHRSWGRSFLRGAVVWRDAIRAARRFTETRDEGRLRQISYERLTEDPERELKELADWLDVPFDRQAFETVASEERWGKSAGVAGVEKRTEDWSGTLSEAQLHLVEGICFDEMRLCGFEPQLARQARQPSRLALKAAKAADGARALSAYARERGWPAAISYKLRQWRHARQA